MSRGGSTNGAGSGNGSPPRQNRVALSDLYKRCRADIEVSYPHLLQERFFSSLDAFMVICEVEKEALRVGGFTWFLRTPEDAEPRLTIYFTYASGQVVMRSVTVDAE